MRIYFRALGVGVEFLYLGAHMVELSGLTYNSAKDFRLLFETWVRTLERNDVRLRA